MEWQTAENFALYRQYLEGYLEGSSVLGDRAAQFLRKNGEILVLLPEEMADFPADINHGGIRNAEGAVVKLASFLKNELQQEKRMLLFENPMHKKGDSFLSGLGYEFFACGDNICFLLKDSSSSLGFIIQMIGEVLACHEPVVYVCSSRILSEACGTGSISILDTADAVVKIIARVFDGETFLVWQRKDVIDGLGEAG